MLSIHSWPQNFGTKVLCVVVVVVVYVHVYVFKIWKVIFRHISGWFPWDLRVSMSSARN